MKNSAHFLKLNVLEAAIALAIMAVSSNLVAQNFTFYSFWYLIAFATMLSGFAMLVLISKHTKTAILCFLVAGLLIVVSLPRVGEMFPLNETLIPRKFEESRLSEVLHHIALSRGEASPNWRFDLSTEALAKTRVSIEISETIHLEEVLSNLAKQVDAEFSWHWHKGHCGGDPNCAVFRFRSLSDKSQAYGSVLIDYYGVCGMSD